MTTIRPTLLMSIAAATLSFASTESEGEPALSAAPEVSNVIDGVVFEAGNWEPDLDPGTAGKSRGNHRAVVVVDPGQEEAVLVTIPWRRPDRNPAAKGIVVINAATDKPVLNTLALRIENLSGDIAFQPVPGSATYHIYYLPWESIGNYYPRITYSEPASTAEANWERRVRSAKRSDLPRARTTHIQSVNAFHGFHPMEIIASDTETDQLMANAPDGWVVVPEHRDRPVRMRRFVPQHWAKGCSTDAFALRAMRGEYVTFQLALISGAGELNQIRVAFGDFPGAIGETLTCFNCGGINEKGEPFANEVSVPAGAVQSLWIGLEIPEDQPPGLCTGEVTVLTAKRGKKKIRVTLDIQPDLAVNHGFDSPEFMSRLKWLDSTAGSDPDFIIAPYQPVRLDGKSLSILGRKVELGASGMPDRLLSHFSPELTHLAAPPQSVLARPIELQITINDQPEPLVAADYTIRQEARGRASWTTESRSSRVAVHIEGALEYDGMLDYRIVVEALQDIDVDDIAIPVALVPDAAEYMLGLGHRGGKRPQHVDWKWNVKNHQEGVWLGAVHAGLQYVLRDDSYIRPLNTNFYHDQPLRMPASWCNGGRGGIRIETDAHAVTAANYSGPRRMAAGDLLHYNIRFLITPFKTIDTGAHLRTHFVHQYAPVDLVAEWGGTVVNIHHANEINPYINYPFFNLERQSAYIREAHAKGIKVKLYNTIRELTYRTHELFALRSLGDEILNDGEGGGHSWMQEHLDTGYHPAWHAWQVDDASLLNKGNSRWTNYYIEGLAWLAANQHIDGLYLDDIAFDRDTVKRMISVLHKHRDEIVIDLHSANQFNEGDGFINSAMLYMEHLPFISRLWFGEYFEYERDEHYWLTEVSGLPFGLMGEMLQDGGHPYRGLLFGMTARMYGDVDPRPVWRMMDAFGIAESRMLGYWLKDVPITTDHPRVLATTYSRAEGVLVALASWSGKEETVSVTIDRKALGLPNELRAFAPSVEGIQAGGEVNLSQVRVPANQGLFLIVRPTVVSGP